VLLDFVVIVFFYIFCVLFCSIRFVFRFCSVRLCCVRLVCQFCSNCVLLNFVLLDCVVGFCSACVLLHFLFLFTYILFCYTAIVVLFFLCSVTFVLSHCALLDRVLADSVLIVCVSGVGELWCIVGNNYQFRSTFI
jgi:hypothetical protein